MSSSNQTIELDRWVFEAPALITIAPVIAAAQGTTRTCSSGTSPRQAS